MNQLEEARIKINQIDAEIAKLFEQRMTAVESILQYKLEKGLAIFDAAREQEVLKKNVALLHKNELKPYFEKYLQAGMDISKEYQQHIISNRK